MITGASSNFAQFDAPDLAPIIMCELTADGWRGLTEDGEIYDVRGSGKVELPTKLCIRAGDGRPLGYRVLPGAVSDPGVIDDYLDYMDRANALTRANALESALPIMEQALALAPTVRARYGRAMLLLGLGRWREGLNLYEQCERVEPFMRPWYREALAIGLVPWRGESLAGKKILLTHDHGFGDSIMCLRFVPVLKAMGADVTILAPHELKRLAEQMAPVVNELIEVDYFCPLIHLLTWLKIDPGNIPLGPYLHIKADALDYWRERIRDGDHCIGIAWSVGYRHKGDYPREIPLADLIEKFGATSTLVSVQTQAEEGDGILCYPTTFDDFYDCAACMLVLDEIVSVDTAALHLAGAIGHPKVTGLLSHWCSWRWLGDWYDNVRLVRQPAPGDWAGALAQC